MHLRLGSSFGPRDGDWGQAGPAATGEPDLAEIRAQHHAKRALEVMAAGGHNLLIL